MSPESTRDERSQAAHDIAVKLIAEERFDIPEWQVALNPASERNEALVNGQFALYPDIVAKHAEEIVAVGEIETPESVCDAEADQWRALGESCPRMYLFVPEGMEEVAAYLIEKYGVSCAGLRKYSIGPDNDLRVESVAISDGRVGFDNHPWWRRLGLN